MLQNWEAFPKHPFSHHVVDKLVLSQKLFWHYRLPLAKGYNLSYETSYMKYQTPPQGQNTTEYANSWCTLSQTATRLSLCFLKDDTVASTFCNKIKLSWEQHNCWEWGEWTWWIQHHVLNICYSEFLSTVHEEVCSKEKIIRETAFKTQHILLYVCIFVSPMDILTSHFHLVFCHLVVNIQCTWLPLEPTL